MVFFFAIKMLLKPSCTDYVFSCLALLNNKIRRFLSSFQIIVDCNLFYTVWLLLAVVAVVYFQLVRQLWPVFWVSNISCDGLEMLFELIASIVSLVQETK
jgi:hypothetical protein